MTVGPSVMLTHRYRLNLSRADHARLSAALDHGRALFNAALEERIDCYRKTGRTLTAYDQMKGLTELRADPAFAGYAATMQRWPLKMLDLAFRAFFKRAKAGAGRASGFPRFKGRDRWRAIGFTDTNGWQLNGDRLTIKGIGALRVRVHRTLPSQPKALVLRRYGRRWFACLAVEVPCAASHDGPAVGLDMGVTHLATLSTGEHIPNIRATSRAAKEVRRRQRALVRCKRGSRNRWKTKERLARAREREANARATHLHQVSADLTRRFGRIAVEALNVKNMIRSAKGTPDAPGANVRAKSGLNRSLADVAPGRLKELLAYKATRAGGQVIEVDPRNTSRTCAACGVIDAASRRAERFRCTGCGHEAHADTNAARNILALGCSEPRRSERRAVAHA